MSSFDNLVHVYNYIRPVIDIAVLAFILYKIYEIVAKTQGLQIFRAVIIIGLIYIFAVIFKLETISWLLSIITPSILVGFAIIFQPELRKIILHIGQRNWFDSAKSQKEDYINSVLIAADVLSKLRRGMLVAFSRNTSLKKVINHGTILNADISSSLITTIFAHDNPLHDGAVIIEDGRIYSAACFLPSSENMDIKSSFGSRHRAALGLAETTDAVVLIVSEETGAISLAYDSKLYFDLTMEQTENLLLNLLQGNSNSNVKKGEENEN